MELYSNGADDGMTAINFVKSFPHSQLICFVDTLYFFIHNRPFIQLLSIWIVSLRAL